MGALYCCKLSCHKKYYKNFNTTNTQRYFQIKLTGHNPISTQLGERERERERERESERACVWVTTGIRKSVCCFPFCSVLQKLLHYPTPKLPL